MLFALILLCASSVDPANCTPANAEAVVRVPGQSNAPGLCLMQAQAYLAQMVHPDDEDRTVRILCHPIPGRNT